jgi:hypothetical protein
MLSSILVFVVVDAEIVLVFVVVDAEIVASGFCKT